MIPKVKSVTPLPNLKIDVTFQDGVTGVIDIGKSLKLIGVLEPLKDPEFFALVHIGKLSKSVTWPGELDLDPVMLYHRATGKSIKWILDQDDPPKPTRKRKTETSIQPAKP